MKTELHKEINRILDPRTAVIGIKEWSDQAIEQLGNVLRINDTDGEGVLYVGNRRLIKVNGHKLPSAQIDLKNLTHEEGLSYALFNGREKLVRRSHQIISWEAQLLRRTRKVSGIPAVECDLVAYNANKQQLVAVEVKLNPESDETNIKHGLLQSMAYGYLLRHSWKTDLAGLRMQIQKCLTKWCDQETKQLPKVKSVACALAAPKDYFQKSLMHNRDTIEWLNKAIKAKGAPFAHFWVLEHDDIKFTKKAESSKCLPQMNYKVRFFSDARSLAKYCL